jgi:hypothetical protein
MVSFAAVIYCCTDLCSYQSCLLHMQIGLYFENSWSAITSLNYTWVVRRVPNLVPHAPEVHTLCCQSSIEHTLLSVILHTDSVTDPLVLLAVVHWSSHRTLYSDHFVHTHIQFSDWNWLLNLASCPYILPVRQPRYFVKDPTSTRVWGNESGDSERSECFYTAAACRARQK